MQSSNAPVVVSRFWTVSSRNQLASLPWNLVGHLRAPRLDITRKSVASEADHEAVSVRRCALQPFALGDGTRLAVGDWACAPSGAINTSPEHYPSPTSFSGFRFVNPTLLPTSVDTEKPATMASAPVVQQLESSKLTDVDHTWLMWGTGRMAW